LSVGSAGGFVPRSTRQPTDRPPLPLPWEQHPPKLLPSRGFLPVRTRRPTRSCPWPKWPAKMAPRVLFFSFLRYEVEIPRRRGVEIPPRIRLSLPQVMAPPQLRGDPCEANLPGLFPTKMAGLRSTSEPSGLFPANYDGGVAVHFFLAFDFLCTILHQRLLDMILVGSNMGDTAPSAHVVQPRMPNTGSDRQAYLNTLRWR